MLAGCTASGSGSGPPESQAEAEALTGCGPLEYDEVRGRPPSYAGQALGRFRNDHAVCAGIWLPGAEDWLVPQGMTIAGDTAYVSGFDGTKRGSERYCSLEHVDLRTGRLLARVNPVRGSVGGRPAVECRHGGGMLLDEHGLWLAETQRLWLLDPATLDVLRGWALVEPVRGSFAAHGPSGQIGLGRFTKERPGRLDWFDPGALLDPSVIDVTAELAAESVPAPRRAQGAIYGRLGSYPKGLWFVTSNSACGILIGPRGQWRAFVPGAESMSLDDSGRLWVSSESGSRLYQRDGRPLTPGLVRVDTRGLDQWQRPECRV